MPMTSTRVWVTMTTKALRVAPMQTIAPPAAASRRKRRAMALPANAMTIRKQKGMTPLTSVRLSPVGRLGCPAARPIKARTPRG